MAQASSSNDTDRQSNSYLIGIGRGIGGALLFAIPMLMTMEMWSLGMFMDRTRLFILLIVTLPLLVVLAHRIGFERTLSWSDALRDACLAYGIGIFSSVIILTVFNQLSPDMSLDEIVGKIALQSVSAGMGALLGRSQLGNDSLEDDDDDDSPTGDVGYLDELFLMAIGALFLSLNIAPTDEMIVIAYKMTGWHALALVVVSVLAMHGFVYAVCFKGSHMLSPDMPWWHAFFRFTMVGYVLALLISFYTLWTFERVDGVSYTQVLYTVIVLGLPASIGAAAARLIL
ncbi:TIGR02587 family membrane protein [Rhizobium sp. CFBP 8762]|uniref:TIGR02587 family membrane protein n=1 Tax=Rhizobium sp. CFBP 8762 TaxID=2775279 RepID=UPI0017842F68|nr:TIGR02587 family membrane protein [Rhizobium sp. CFBP 8762]MBD8555311.1 TIGR02587 family membrane protein [Rhizobium sp. CFBP 8762]